MIKPLIVILAFSIGATVNADSNTQFNLAAADDYIIPGYQKLAQSTAGLKQSSAQFCAQPSIDGLAVVRDQYEQAFTDWQHIQLVRFGPIEVLLRANRFQLWPDKRGTVSKHLARLLKAQDANKLVAGQFEKTSIAVQGFSAMERLLYAKNTQFSDFSGSDKAHYRCRLLGVISHNLETMSAALVKEWSDGENAHRAFFASADKGNSYYEEQSEVTGKLLNNLHTALQVIVDQKLLRPLGSSLQKARSKRAESWRSQQSLNNLRVNLKAAHKLYQSAFAKRINNSALDKQINTAFTASLQKLEAIGKPLFLAVADAGERQKVETLLVAVKHLKALLAGPLPDAVGIPLGFNSLDGD